MTYRDLITRVLRSIGVLHGGETPSADEGLDMLNVVNETLLSIPGVDLKHRTESDLNADFPYPEDHVGPIRRYLAIHFAAEFGTSLSAENVALAADGLAWLQREYADRRELVVDDALQPWQLDRFL